MTEPDVVDLSLRVTITSTVHTPDMALSTVADHEAIIVSPDYHDQFQDFMDATSSRFQRVTPSGGSELVIIGRVVPAGNPVVLILNNRLPDGIHLATTVVKL